MWGGGEAGNLEHGRLNFARPSRDRGGILGCFMLEGKHSWGKMRWALGREMQIEGTWKSHRPPNYSSQRVTDVVPSHSTSSCLRQIVAGDI